MMTFYPLYNHTASLPSTNLKHSSINISQNYQILTSLSNCTNCSSRSSNSNMMLAPAEQGALYIAYILAIVLGATGNIVSIIVFAKGRRCNTDIKPFLINLAVADLMMALMCLPFSFTSALLYEWIWSKPLCPIVLFAQMMSVTASVYTNTAISIDRYLAIKFPLKLIRFSHGHIKWTISLIWIISIGVSAIQLWTSQVVTLPGGRSVCKEVWPGSNPDSRKIFTIAVLVITYIIPVLFIMIMYGPVCAQLWFRTAPGVGDTTRDARQLAVKKKVVKMLIVMIALFTLCWMPLHLFFLLADFAPHVMTGSRKTLSIIYFVVHWLAMSNSFQNPIIYGFLNDNFRSDLAEMLLSCCPRLSSIKYLQTAALANRPLSRLSTRMTVMSERHDSYSGKKYFASGEGLRSLSRDTEPSQLKRSNRSLNRSTSTSGSDTGELTDRFYSFSENNSTEASNLIIGSIINEADEDVDT